MRAMNIRFSAFLSIVGLAFQAPIYAEALPGIWLLEPAGTADTDRRLVVGGTVQEPPESDEQICLGWSWSDPTPELELYPDDDAGTFKGSAITWSSNAASDPSLTSACRLDHFTFPKLGLGPADELWILAPPDQPTQRSSWADLLHATEAFWRQSTSAPLAEQTIGTLEGCRVRSLPVTSDTRLDRWSPFELAAQVGTGGDTEASGDNTELLRTRRFLWWVEPLTSGGDCATASGGAELRLFPLNDTGDDPEDTDATEGPGPETQHLLTVAEVEWQRLKFSELDPADWSPGVRRLLALPVPEGAPEQDPQIRPTAPQRQALLDGRPFDLCEVAGFGKLCARNARARRQLYTAVDDSQTEIPWPEDARRRTQEACQRVLGSASANTTACSQVDLWQQPIAGGLIADFKGELLVAREPKIRESWHDGAVEWRFVPDEDPRQVLASLPDLQIELLDGSSVSIPTSDLLDASDQEWLAWQRWALGAGLVMAFAALVFTLLARRQGPPGSMTDSSAREELESLIENIIDRRLKNSETSSGTPTADAQLSGAANEYHLRDLVQRLAAEAVEERLNLHAEDIRQQATAQARQLVDTAQELEEQLQESSTKLGEELRGSLLHEAQSLSVGLHQDHREQASPFDRLCRELAELPEEEHGPLSAALEAAGQLGDWIDRLWPALQTVVGDLEALPRSLPDPAADEWRQAIRALETFSRIDAAALRQLHRGPHDSRQVPLDGAETAFFEQVGLFADDRPLAERMKRYLAPFDHLGRLGEVTLALQYLVEAYPIEQLAKDQRSRLRQALAEVHRPTDCEQDFHSLIARIAAGVGLRYRPVRYYKSRTDQSDYAFVRQQISPISLSERVGFEATTEKTIIVRLGRPFFFQLSSDIYYAGHARVARG